jgi:hypothetical protein
MKIVTVDQKKRIVLSGAQPGEGYVVREVQAGYMELVKVVPQVEPSLKSPQEVLSKLDEEPLTPTKSWDDLKSQTRE